MTTVLEQIRTDRSAARRFPLKSGLQVLHRLDFPHLTKAVAAWCGDEFMDEAVLDIANLQGVLGITTDHEQLRLRTERLLQNLRGTSRERLTYWLLAAADDQLSMPDLGIAAFNECVAEAEQRQAALLAEPS